MARAIALPGAGQVKVIHPWLAFLLAFVTLGVYYVLWYGIRNSELNDFGTAHQRDGRNPLEVGTFGPIAAITIGGIFIIPPFVSQWRFCRRIARAEQLVGLDRRVRPVIGMLLLIPGYFLLPLEIVYFQTHLNRLWEAAEEAALRGA